MTISNDFSGANTLCATVCASAVLAYFGVAGTTWNKRTKKNVWADTLRRGGYAVRSRTSQLSNRATVGGSRAKLRAIAEAEPSVLAFLVQIEGHILLLDREGVTEIDTSPRKRDSRKVVKVYAVSLKEAT